MAIQRSHAHSRSPATQSDRLSSSNSSPSRFDIFDCQSAFEVVDFIRQFRSSATEQVGPAPNFDYRACFDVLREEREKLGFSPAQKSLAVATVDSESDSQARFLTAISKLFDYLEPIDFRDASITLPLGGDTDPSERRYVRSLAPNIMYVVGLLAGRQQPEVVIVTRAFELFGPLQDFVTKRNGKAAIAFFRRYLDRRFAQAGLFDADSPVRFIDLDPHSERIVGCDVRQIGAVSASKTVGISGI